MTEQALNEEARNIALAVEILLARINLDTHAATLEDHMSATDVLRGLMEPRSELQQAAIEITRDPVGRAYRIAIRTLGDRLFEAGGLALMDAVLAVIEHEVDQPSWYAAMLDRLWDGIGRTDDSEGWTA